MTGRRKRKDAGSLEAAASYAPVAEEHTRVFLAEAIAQIESSLSRDLERHKELQYSTRLGIETFGQLRFAIKRMR